MRSDVMAFFKLTRPFSYVGYFETDHQKDLLQELKGEIQKGGLVAISGVVGCGKTTLLYRLQAELQQTKNILVSRSLAVDKDRVNLTTLMTALFYIWPRRKTSSCRPRLRSVNVR